MELIDKTALVTEIEKRQKRNQLDCSPEGSGAYYEDGFIVDIINSLGVKKEVDLGEELSDFIMSYRNKETGYSLYQLAEHFFNLGLKAKRTEGICKISETECPNFDEAQGTPI